MRVFRLCAIVLLLVLGGVNFAYADKRVALVIGNSTYKHVTQLANPKNDAGVLAQTFREIGFDTVTLKHDLDATALRKALGQFARDAAGSDIAVIYFAGHGIEVDGTNYVIPTDAKLSHVDDVDFEAVELSKLVRSLNRAKKLKLVILDACRNNPFKNNMQGLAGGRSVGRGLARVSLQTSDTLVAYAAREGTIASDGTGQHSPYAHALIKHVATPGLDVRLMFGRVRDDVLEATGRKQEPFTYGSLSGRSMALTRQAPVQSDAGAGSSAPSAADVTDREALFWSSIRGSSNADAFRAFLKKFPEGTFSELAKIKIQELTKQARLSKPDETPDRVAGASGAGACDRLAGAPTDLENKTRLGIAFPDLKKRAKEAISACRSVVAQAPQNSRFKFQLARALHAGGELDQAIPMYRQLAENGYAAAANNLGVIHNLGNGVPKDLKIATHWLSKAGSLGYVHAYATLGAIYEKATEVPDHKREALTWFSKAAASGNAGAMNTLGIAYKSGDRFVPKDLKQAAYWITKSAEAGEPFAMSNLGAMYENGEGVGQSYAEAVRWYRKAMEKSDRVPYAAHRLGWAYRRGRSVAQDDEKAVELFEIAANAGMANAMADVGYMRLIGVGTTLNYDIARSWFQKAAEKGNAAAMGYLGIMHAQGNGVDIDYAKAASWYKRAAEAGDTPAMINLARLFEAGQGVRRDMPLAAQWLTKATKLGDSIAYGLLTRNAKTLSRPLRREVQNVLKREGHYTGSIDGQFGPGTRRAVDKLVKK